MGALDAFGFRFLLEKKDTELCRRLQMCQISSNPIEAEHLVTARLKWSSWKIERAVECTWVCVCERESA